MYWLSRESEATNSCFHPSMEVASRPLEMSPHQLHRSSVGENVPTCSTCSFEMVWGGNSTLSDICPYYCQASSHVCHSWAPTAHEEFLMKNGIHHVKSAPYHSASNRLAERHVQTFQSFLKKCNDLQQVSQFLFQYNFTLHFTTGVSPAQLLMGRLLLTHLDCMSPSGASRGATFSTTHSDTPVERTHQLSLAQ